MNYDASGQPLASTFGDYLLPGPTEVPAPRLDHMETLAPYTEFGVKGIGEGGAIAPPAAIGNAVNDAANFISAQPPEVLLLAVVVAILSVAILKRAF